IQCILISRYEPPPRLVHLLANSKMESIGWEDIKFSLGESETFVNTYLKKRIPMDTLQKLYEKTRGWAAGLVLLMKEMNAEPEALAPVRPERIFDYFASEILGKMDGMTREFLMKASFLPKIPARSAEKLTGLETAGKILSGLSRSNYFIERRNTGSPVFQMHPLFREFLNAKAVETYSKEEITAVKRAEAAMLEEDGQIEDAAELWSQSEEWAALSALILKNAGELVNQGRAQTLERWISWLPESVLEGSPWLLYWLGLCRMGFNPSQARVHLEKAFQGFSAGGDLAGALLSWSFIADSYLYEWDDFSSLGGWIDRLYSLMGAKTGFRFPSRQIEAKVAASMMCAMVSCRPSHPDAERWSELALALAKDFGDPASRLQTITFGSYFYGWRGDFKRSVHLADEISMPAGSPDVSPLFKIAWLMLSAVNNLFITPFPAKALEKISAARELADRTGVHVWDHMTPVIGACAALLNGDFRKADEFLNDEAALRAQPRISLSHFLFVSGYREFLAGNLVQASAHAEVSLKYATEAGYPYAAALCHFESAQVKHALGQFEEAQEHIRSVQELSAGSEIFNFMCLLARAQFAFSRGEEDSALGFLREGFRIGRQQNYLGFIWWWDPPVMSRLCARALEAAIEPDYARELVRKRGLIEYAAPVEVESWPWPVKIHTLGEFRIVLDGRPLDFSGKAQQKPLTLLKILIALGHRDIPEEKITDLLWPDAEGDLAHKSYEINCLRLRRIIGEKAVRISGGLASLDEKYCWTDLKAITHVMDQAENEWKKAGKEQNSTGKAIGLTEKAIGLHRGYFLPPDAGQAWAMTVREQIKNRLLRLVINAGKYLMRTGQWEAAIEKFEKGLEMDNLVEEIYQDLMLCQISLGRHAEAARTYEQCRKALSETLGINPSPSTNNIYKSIF
ncbi:MAG: BTAD domain-containing putative transcriptional regulator, partial [Nitrospiraceae bacterium]|nr:BTAD domain-containing putative transcriptional regulator [Nitrospiraceae bacterium]